MFKTFKGEPFGSFASGGLDLQTGAFWIWPSLAIPRLIFCVKGEPFPGYRLSLRQFY